MSTPERIYYWDGVVLVSDQRILLGHWLYDPAKLGSAEVTKVENKKRNLRPYLAVSGFLILASLVLFVLDLGFLDPLVGSITMLAAALIILGLIAWVVLYLRRKQPRMVFVKDVPDIYLLRIHRKRGIGSDYVSLDRSYLENVAIEIERALSPLGRSPGKSWAFANLQNASVPVPPLPVLAAQDSCYFDGLVEIGPSRARFGDKTYSTADIEATSVQPVAPDSPSWLFLLVPAIYLVQGLSYYVHRTWPNVIDLGPIPATVMLLITGFYIVWLSTNIREYFLVNIRGSFGTHSVYVTADRVYANQIVEALRAATSNSYRPSNTPLTAP